MRIDDPQVLAVIERLDDTADTLRRLAGFPPRIPTPETTASRAPRWCPVDGCNDGLASESDLIWHLEHEHGIADGSGTETCAYCNRGFRTREQRDVHVHIDHEDELTGGEVA